MPEWPATTAAVIGLGDISTLHLDAIATHPAIDLVAVCDIDPARVAAAADRWAVPGYTDHRELLADRCPNVVHLTTPHDQHVPIALAALAAGAHVLTEKPVAESVAAAQRLRDAARTSDRKIGVALQNRYNPSAQAIREVLDAGRIGTVEGARAAVWWSRTADYYAAAPWRGRWASAGGGVLINQALHTIDLLLWFLGEPLTVRGQATNLAHPGIEVEDAATIAIEHPGGVRSLLFATIAHHRNDDVELEIVGERGIVRLTQGRAELITAAGIELLATDSQPGGERSYWGKGHELLIGDFHARLAEPEPFWIGLAAGLECLTVLREVYVQSGLVPADQR